MTILSYNSASKRNFKYITPAFKLNKSKKLTQQGFDNLLSPSVQIART